MEDRGWRMEEDGGKSGNGKRKRRNFKKNYMTTNQTLRKAARFNPRLLDFNLNNDKGAGAGGCTDFEAGFNKLRGVCNSPGLLTVLGQIEGQLRLTQDRAAARDFSMDVRVAWLSGHVGNLANNTERRHSLLRVAAVTVAWLEAMDLPPVLIHTGIADERRRQSLSGEQVVEGTDGVAAGWGRLRGLVVALGQVARAVAELESQPRSESIRNQLMAELVQLAALAVAWLERGVGREGSI